MIEDNIRSGKIHIGINTVIEATASIRGLSGTSKSISIGDNCYIGHNVQIICDNFSIGDFSKIHHDSNIHGYKYCAIGHNAWIGQFVIIDSIGSAWLGNNVCIGSASHLWSHIKYGDRLEGCRFLDEKPLIIGNDVWIAGNCTVTPIIAQNKSMLLANSVATKDMDENKVYAGNPAVDITDRVGPQFRSVSNEEKLVTMKEHLGRFYPNCESIEIVVSTEEFKDNGKSYFAVSTREYLKTQSNEEIAFMKYLLPEKAKFTPIEFIL